MTWLFDSHIHLSDPAYKHSMDFILAGMQRLKIKACCVSMDNTNSDQTLSLAKKSSLVLPFIGIHPENACGEDDCGDSQSYSHLDAMVSKIHKKHEEISGIGEIGLDPTFADSKEDYKKQIYVFETLLGLAEKYGKPVSIHSRKSLCDVLEILSSFSLKGVLIHWFDGNKKQLRHTIDLGCYVSFGPVMIYANDKQSLLQKSDPSRILVETDGPVSFSRCFEQKSAQIAFIPSIVFCASKLLRKSYDETALMLYNNSTNYLGI